MACYAGQLLAPSEGLTFGQGFLCSFCPVMQILVIISPSVSLIKKKFFFVLKKQDKKFLLWPDQCMLTKLFQITGAVKYTILCLLRPIQPCVRNDSIGSPRSPGKGRMVRSPGQGQMNLLTTIKDPTTIQISLFWDNVYQG